MESRLTHLHSAIKAYAIVFVFWGLYRLVFRLPEAIEETILKPIVFVGSVFLVERPRRWDKYFLTVWGAGDWFKSLFLGLGFGLLYIIFYGFASFLSFGKLQLGSELANNLWASFIGLGIVTAVWEEWLFSGYIFSELKKFIVSPMTARIITALLFAMIHLPILAFGYKFTGTTLIFQLVLLSVLGLGNTILIGFSKNLLAPIVAHTLWGVAIYLFR